MGSKHASIVDVLVEVLTLGARGRVLVRAQGPIAIPPHNEPLPDVALLRPRAQDVLFVIEVADATLARDRDLKIPILCQARDPRVLAGRCEWASGHGLSRPDQRWLSAHHRDEGRRDCARLSVGMMVALTALFS
jgi:hypothetical protein